MKLRDAFDIFQELVLWDIPWGRSMRLRSPIKVCLSPVRSHIQRSKRGPAPPPPPLSKGLDDCPLLIARSESGIANLRDIEKVVHA